MATREEQRREHNEQKELESLRRVFDVRRAAPSALRLDTGCPQEKEARI